MKTNFTLSLIVMLIAFNQLSHAQTRIAHDKFDVGNFHTIKASTVANISIKQSNTTEVTAEGNEELLNALDVQLRNGILILDMNDKILRKYKKRNDRLKINISVPSLKEIEHEGVGGITIRNKFSVPELIINSEGVGNITAENLDCDFVKVDLEGVGNISLAGVANRVEIDSEGMGNISAVKLKANEAIVSSEGVGNVSCYASDFLKVRSEGIGSVDYYGNPARKDLGKKGIGRINARRN